MFEGFWDKLEAKNPETIFHIIFKTNSSFNVK